MDTELIRKEFENKENLKKPLRYLSLTRLESGGYKQHEDLCWFHGGDYKGKIEELNIKEGDYYILNLDLPGEWNFHFSKLKKISFPVGKDGALLEFDKNFNIDLDRSIPDLKNYKNIDKNYIYDLSVLNGNSRKYNFEIKIREGVSLEEFMVQFLNYDKGSEREFKLIVGDGIDEKEDIVMYLSELLEIKSVNFSSPEFKLIGVNLADLLKSSKNYKDNPKDSQNTVWLREIIKDLERQKIKNLDFNRFQQVFLNQSFNRYLSRESKKVVKKGNVILKKEGINKNQILYGPPGTGKTFITKKKAVEIIFQ